MTIIHYLAYGSNLHPYRLRERIPSSQIMGIVELEGYRLAFHKRGQDGSGKCNLVSVDKPGAKIFGVLYEMHIDEKPLLDAYEGEGYRTEAINVILFGKRYESFAYIAEDSHIDERIRPYHWYKELVLLGAEYHHLPGDYIDNILEIESDNDPDPTRTEQHHNLLRQIFVYGV
jgi:gamma-glutamylcyclotransferase